MGRHPKTFTQADSSSFDHLVGALLEVQRHVKAERFRSFEIDH
jgi:hypothetical protein